MSKPQYPKRYLKVIFTEYETDTIVRCTYIPNPTATGFLDNVFDMYVEDLKQAYIPYTKAVKVLYGE